jgi:hypothetical protein
VQGGSCFDLAEVLWWIVEFEVQTTTELVFVIVGCLCLQGLYGLFLI